MTAEIVTDVQRPPSDVIAEFEGIGAADVHEAMGKAGGMGPEISRVAGGSVVGPATTVRLPTGDNMMIHVGAKVAAPGDVLVIEATTDRGATWGELATTNAQRKGIAGVVSGGNVRDVEEIREMDFPLFASAVNHVGAVKETPGSVNVPVTVGGTIVNPGDLVVGDGDGVTVVPREEAAEALEAARNRIEDEDEIRERIRAGEDLFEIGGYDEKLRDHGLALDDA